MRRLVAVLACRNQGSRLYGKPLQNLDVAAGVTVLETIITALRSVDVVAEVVLGIAEGTDNHVYVDFARANGLPWIVGDERDVLGRLVQCGEQAHATDVFRMTSESPFPYLDMADAAWQHHVDTDADTTFVEPIIDGCGFEILSLAALQRSHREGDEKHRSEFCTLFIREHKDEFTMEYLRPPPDLVRTDLRFTVDYPEDLIVCRQVYQALKARAPRIPLHDAVRFMDEHPQLRALIAPYCEEGYATMYL